MAHARVAIYTFKPGAVDEVIGKAEREIVPMFQKHPGFISYMVARGSDDTVISFSLWKSKKAAEEANQLTAEWVRENLSRVLVSVERHVGLVAFSFPPHEIHIPSD